MRIAYFTKTKARCFLTIARHVPFAVNQRFENAETVNVSGKREARAYCLAQGIEPWNF